MIADVRQKEMSSEPSKTIDESSLQDPEMIELLNRCRSFLIAQSWVTRIKNIALAYGIGGIVGVFIAKVEPSNTDIPADHWVIVGDLPPAYLDYEDNPNWQSAIEGYIAEMTLWIHAVRCGEPLDDIIPVSAEPTDEHAEMLASRLDFLKDNLLGAEPPLPNYQI